MKYAVLTTKHHEGFCLFDSQYTDYKCTNTPAGRDLVREYVDAFRAEGLKIGFYYSLIDWHHPDFPIDPLHPRRDDENVPEMNRGRDMRSYAQYMRNQVTELLTNYGKIDILWFDFSYPGQQSSGKALASRQGKGRLGSRKADCYRPQPAARDHYRQPHRDRAGPLGHRSNISRRRGYVTGKLANSSPGRPARPFPGHGDTTATKQAGNRRKC